MGLAGRKEKQRIPADPRNLSWADDASRFGLSYLSKFGWDVSQGLGSSGDGMKTHLKVQQKLDMAGIGTQHQRDPSGIAWKQNKEFEALLERLNESAEREKGADSQATQGRSGQAHSTFVSTREDKIEECLMDESPFVMTVKRRKRKNKDDLDASRNAMKKQKKDKEKHPKSGSDTPAIASSVDQDLQSATSSTGFRSEPIPKPRPMAHRARIRAAKRIAGKSESAISEILGIVPSSCMSPSTSAPTPPSPSTLAPQPSSLSLDNLITSTKSVADYFKERLLARSTASSSPSSSAPSGSATPGLGANSLGTGLSNMNVPPPVDEGGSPRRGIGSQVPAMPKSGSASAFASGGGDGNTDGRDTPSEKPRRKAERKAEKSGRREAGAKHPIPKNLSSITMEQLEKDDAENKQRASKKVEKMEKCEEQKQHPPDPSNLTDSGVAEESHNTPRCFFPNPNEKSTEKHKKKRS